MSVAAGVTKILSQRSPVTTGLDRCLLRSCSNRLRNVLSSYAIQYHAFARECLEMAEKADDPGVRLKLIELSRQWMEAALMEERREASRETPPPSATSANAPG
jgi:hypothetical protein